MKNYNNLTMKNMDNLPVVFSNVENALSVLRMYKQGFAVTFSEYGNYNTKEYYIKSVKELVGYDKFNIQRCLSSRFVIQHNYFNENEYENDKY